MKYTFASASLLALALAGCGGGGGGSSSAVSNPQKTPIGGGLVAEAFITGSPITVGGSGTTVTGLTGAFSNIVWNNPNPRNEQTLIAYSIWDELRVMDWNGGNDRLLYLSPTEHRLFSIAFSYFGDSVFFVENGQLKRIPLSGGSPITVLSGVSSVTVAPHTPQIAYVSNGNIFRASQDGTGATLVRDDASNYSDVFWAQPERLFGRINSSAWQLINPTDGSFSSSTGEIVAASRQINYRWIQSFDTSQGYLISTSRSDGAGGGFGSGFDLNTHLYSFAAPSADDQFFLTREASEASDFFGADRIVRRSINGGTAVGTVKSITGSRGNINDVDAQRFVRTKLVTGVGSQFAWTAHALMWANSGANPGGLALVRANTPTSLKMSANDSLQVGTNILYTVECDVITRLAFTVDRNYNLVTAPLTTGNNGAIINFNASTGDVVNVITYTVTRDEAKPQVEKVGRRIRISGSLTGVFDRHAKPVATNGASILEIDANGKLTVVR